MRIWPWFWYLVNTLARGATFIRLRVRRVVESEPPTGPVLICAKHATGWDIPLMAESCRKLHRSQPYFQMGSFVGYPVLGLIGPMLCRLGGFPVMRPKEVRRLSRKRGWTRDRALQRMRAVNEEAETIRRQVLAEGRALVVFPEGTRDASRVLPLLSDHEVKTACAVISEGNPVSIWPVVLAFGPPRFFRRRVLIRFLPPFVPDPPSPGEVLERVARAFEATWIPPDGV